MVAVGAGLLGPVRGHWDVTLAGVAGVSTVVQAVAAPAVIRTGFQAAPVVRRGPERLLLAPGARADLDSRAADWAVSGCVERCDLAVTASGGVEETGSGELADKSAAYYSCLAAREFGFTIAPATVAAGAQACGRTSDGRTAAITVNRDFTGLLVLTVTVWEPPPVPVLRSDEEEPPLFQDLPDDQ